MNLEYTVLCECGTYIIPLLAKDESSKNIVRAAYCPDCIFYEFPNLNFFTKAYLLEATDPKHNGIVFPIDHKSAACYSLECGGFFAVRFDILFIQGNDLVSFRLPMKENTTIMPQCYKCKNLEFTKFEKTDDQWYLGMRCKKKLFAAPGNMINIKCKDFEGT